ncbi:hypothetical protein A2U01_0077026, partial [Trifolium medium]|nr:hypothetical protein [Trifolium medium]
CVCLMLLLRQHRRGYGGCSSAMVLLSSAIPPLHYKLLPERLVCFLKFNDP